MFKAATATADNVRASPKSYDSAVTPFTTRHGLPIFNFYEKDTQRSIRFAKAMAGWAKCRSPFSFVGIFRASCFSKFGFSLFPVEYRRLTRKSEPEHRCSERLLSMGQSERNRCRCRRWQRQGLHYSSKGKEAILTFSLLFVTFFSHSLIQSFPNLNFVVQDSADMHVAGQSLLTDDTRGRVTFMQHSFFDPQPVGDAAAFILRACALNWCDARVVDMFRALVPGLERSKPGTPLLINDMILPDQGVLTRDVERGMRQIDLIMLVGFGGKLRTADEFEALLKQADERYEIRSIRPEGLIGLVEAHLRR